MGLLEELLDLIRADNEAREAKRTRLVVLGDFIDRGPHASQVAAFLYSARKRRKPVYALLGNHEAALLRCLTGDENAQRMWLRFGGLSTLASFGIAPPFDDETPSTFARRLGDQLPTTMIDWIENLPLALRSGDYFFCHAGVRPGVPLPQQKPSDLLWIRDEFLESSADHGAVVVHGHTICGTQPEFARNRINVDTGAYRNGILSAVGLDGSEQWTVATQPKKGRGQVIDFSR